MQNLSLDDALLLRQYDLEVRDAYHHARPQNRRWQEVDAIFAAARHALANSTSVDHAGTVRRDAVAELKRLADLDHADKLRETELINQARADQRLEEHRRQARIAWAERVSAPLRASTRTLKDRLDRANERLGAIGTESELREVFGDIADALTAMKATLDLEVRASITRETDAAKKAA